jgi:hypothetical protein
LHCCQAYIASSHFFFFTTRPEQLEVLVTTYNGYRGFNPVDDFIALHIWPFINGLRTDLILAITLGLMLALVKRHFAFLAYGLLVSLYAASLEHLRHNMTNIDLSVIGLGADTTFILAQMTQNGISKLLVTDCKGLVRRRLSRHFRGVIYPEAERIGAGVTV